MQVRDFLFYWHLATYTKSYATNNAAWEQLQHHAGSDELDLAWLTPEQRALWRDPALQAQARQVWGMGPFVTRLDAAYPPRLAESFQPPAVLFYQGNWHLLTRLCLAIVGARHAGAYTRKALAWLRPGLMPMTVVSGLAAGADTLAHEFALAQGWPTVAVLANGLDQVYPQANRDLQQRIAKAGLVISEYPYGVKPMPYRFVARNRLIAGLAHGVLVTEAAAHSGSLITANLALQANREVFAVPNRVDVPLGVGTNALIQAGAKPVLRGSDIIEEMQYYP
ncbi:DNA-processing protein DprA [Lacticaseibacillus baoqingensis]|uniref:DNA-processing protein DprA n=1 Tax=Lacticaseibacillus baoqingensis TaxID=2486013 RepID=A0ABW4E8B8_9LACO|nr:DNA-processing protein DprA [Lacticaseibacillus baoqingensis]